MRGGFIQKLFNITIKANIVDPDQTAPTVNVASNILVDDKKHIFCDYAL